MPDEIMYIIDRLNEFSHSAYIVGGSLRDYYLNIEPYDYDIATSAKPWEIKEIFKDSVISDVGEKYGTIVVRINTFDVEITTFRLEGKYENNRKPEEVVFSDNISNDLKRRDFTINSMAYNKNEGLIDIFGAKDDIKNKIIRTVGSPEIRLEEDALRILRCIRLSAKLGFKIEDKLYKAIKEKRELLNNLSKERIKQELDKILLSDKPSDAFRIMLDTGVLEIILPDLYKTVNFDQKSPYHSRTLFEHIMCVVDNVDKKLNLRYAALFHDVAKLKTLTVDEKGIGHFYGHDELGAEESKKILKNYNSDNELMDSVGILIGEHMKAHNEMSDKALRRQIRKVGKENIFDLYNLMIADRLCTIDGRDIDFLLNRIKRIEELLKEETVTEKKFLKVNGKDIISLGFNEGKIVGEILKYLEDIVLENPALNDKNRLLEIAVKKYRR